jgi:hypothetical protein
MTDSSQSEITHQAPALPRRCETNPVGLFGERTACGAWQEEGESGRQLRRAIEGDLRRLREGTRGTSLPRPALQRSPEKSPD